MNTTYVTNRIGHLVVLLIAFIAVFSSCTKGFEEINTDPNGPVKIEADFLFTGSIFSTLNLYGGNMNRIVFFNYTQHFSGFQGEFQRFNYSNAENNQYWKQTYVNILQPLHRIKEEYKDDPKYKNRVTIAQIWKAFVYSNTLAIWGGMPMGEALQGEPNVPFVGEKEAYVQLLAELRDLAGAIDPKGDTYSNSADKVFGGDLLKWKRFANALRLRLAMRISNAQPNGDSELAERTVKELFDQKEYLMSGDDHSARAKWGGDQK